MEYLRKRKDKIFEQILKTIDKDFKINTKHESLLVASCYEKTFEIFNQLIESELRRNYIKKNKPKTAIAKRNRLQSI